MAAQRTTVNPSIYDHPVWPDRLPDAYSLRLRYGALADEMVVLFDEERHRNPAYVFIATPDYEYASIKVDGDSGEVVGVMVYPLKAYALKHHPSWRAAAYPRPHAEVAERIVRDIKALYVRYGIDTGGDEPDR